MRIVLVAGIDPGTTRAGGTRSYVLGLAKALSKSGEEVIVVGAGSQGKCTQEGYQFLPVTANPTPSSYEFLTALATHSLWLPLRGAILHAQRPDDLAAFTLRRDLTARILTMHGNALIGINERHGAMTSAIYRILEALAMHEADRVIVLEEQTSSEIRSAYPSVTKSIVRCPNGVDLDMFSPSSRTEARACIGLEDQPTIAYIGRLAPEKNLSLLLETYDILPPVQLLIAGDGPLWTDVCAWAKKHRGVTLVRTVDHGTVPSLLNAADVLALPSHREASPTICLESLACGTPVVSTPVGGMRDLIQDGVNGYVAPPEAKAFGELLMMALARSSLMRTACRESSARFGWDRIAPQLLRVYEEAAA